MWHFWVLETLENNTEAMKSGHVEAIHTLSPLVSRLVLRPRHPPWVSYHLQSSLGLSYFQNIWICSLISIFSIYILVHTIIITHLDPCKCLRPGLLLPPLSVSIPNPIPIVADLSEARVTFQNTNLIIPFLCFANQQMTLHCPLI